MSEDGTITLTQEEHDALQRESAAGRKRAEAEAAEQKAREDANPPTHALQLASGRWVEGHGMVTHMSFKDDEGHDVVVPVASRFPL